MTSIEEAWQALMDIGQDRHITALDDDRHSDSLLDTTNQELGFDTKELQEFTIENIFPRVDKDWMVATTTAIKEGMAIDAGVDLLVMRYFWWGFLLGCKYTRTSIQELNDAIQGDPDAPS